MPDNLYRVVRGDSLWKIARKELGSGSEWPRIWKYNNRREVMKVTGKGVHNPDLIVVGQALLIPRLGPAPDVAPHSEAAPALPEAAEPSAQPTHVAPMSQRAPQSLRQPNTLSGRLPAVQSPIAFKYKLDDIRWPPIDVGTAIVETRMTGDLVLMTKKAYPATYVTSRGEVEHQVTAQANTAFGKLINDNRYIYDPAQKRITFRSMLVSQSSAPNTVATAVGVELSSNSPIPKLRAEFRMPKLEGNFDVFNYTAFDMKVVLEITPKPQKQPPQGPSAQPVRVQATNWDVVIGAGIVASGVVILTATVVEDFLTGLIGTVDDPASVAAAMAAFARGIGMMRGAAVLPVAGAAASVTVKTTVQTSNGAN